MLILEVVGNFFVEIIFQGVILGTFKLIGRGYDFLRRKLRGLPTPPISPIKKLEKKLLYKEIILKEDVNPAIRTGMNGVVLEIIDEQTVFAEFLDANKNQIQYADELVFEVKMSQFRLVFSDKTKKKLIL
jgi:ribosomal protein L23